jgi:hypothetical protein
MTTTQQDIEPTEAELERAVLEELHEVPQHGLQIATSSGLPRAGIKDALVRCLVAGWAEINDQPTPDDRPHLTAAGVAELARRRAADAA